MKVCKWFVLIYQALVMSQNWLEIKTNINDKNINHDNNKDYLLMDIEDSSDESG